MLIKTPLTNVTLVLILATKHATSTTKRQTFTADRDRPRTNCHSDYYVEKNPLPCCTSLFESTQQPTLRICVALGGRRISYRCM